MSKSMTSQLFGPSTLLDLVKGIRAANNDSAAYSERQQQRARRGQRARTSARARARPRAS
jgi:hypothetical protein